MNKGSDKDQPGRADSSNLAGIKNEAGSQPFAQQNIQTFKDQFRLAVDTIPGLVWSALPDGDIDFLNQRWLEYTGLTLEQAQGWGWRVAIHYEDLASLESYWRSLLASGQPGETEARLRRFDGTYRWFLFRGVPLYDSSQKLVRWYGQTTDIDDRKRAEEKLRESEAFLVEAQRLSRTGSFGWNVATNDIIWSDETFCILGYNRSVKPTLDLVFNRVHPEDIYFVQSKLEEAKKKQADFDFEHRLLMTDGKVKHIHVMARPIIRCQGVLEYVGAVMDITERQEAAEALRASEHLARGQVDALTRTLAALSQESEPEKLLQHVLEMIGCQLGTQSLGVWELNEAIGRVEILANFEDGNLRFPTETEKQASPQFGPATQYHPIWTEFFQTGAHCIIGEIESDTVRVRVAEIANSSWHDWASDAVVNPTSRMLAKRLHELGFASTLAVPTFVAGKVTGLISIRFKQRRSFRPEEIALTRALAHQAMLAIQLIRLSQQSRQAAIVAERNRMARDIHDTLAQGFTGVIMQLEAAKGAAAQGNLSEVAHRMARASDLARSSLEEARRSVRALRPRTLREGKLSIALDTLLKRMTEGTGLNAEFKAEGDDRAIPADFEESLLRIAQESLTNTIKHADARSFSVTLSISLGKIQLQLADDGRGFNPQGEHDGFGLMGMKERVDRMGGEFTLRSKPGLGTEILIVVKNPNTTQPKTSNEQDTF